MQQFQYSYKIKVSSGNKDSFTHRISHFGEGRDDALAMAEAIHKHWSPYNFNEDPTEARLTAEVVNCVKHDYTDSTFRE